ncbi:MAG TPA: IS21 family transposase [Rhodocyclaceae bacterium]|nr:IS21 family transposase [Rhodocyclaceae bacterium]HNM79499.1 IS21 family transposase [Rhodocyclaceae bacterium]
MNLLGRIRRLYYRDGLTLSEIERRTGVTRKTIRKWLNAPERVEPRYRRESGDTKITPFADRLVKMLETDTRRTKRERRSARKLHAELQALGFEGDYSRVTAFIRRWRASGGSAVTKAYVPLQFEPGEAHQFDWSEERLVIGGVWRKLLVAHLKLCYSRAFVLQAYPTQGHEMLFDAHARAFAALGGIPRRGIYDNMKTAVDKVKRGKARVVNTRFAAMASHYLFDPDFCNVASGWEKGVVEKNVQDSRRRIWQDAAAVRFGSFTELNLWLLARCRALWQTLKHPGYDLTLAEMLEQERPSLMPMIVPFDGYVETIGKVSSTCLVNVDRCRYSAPCELVGQLVGIRLYPERIDFVAQDAVVASHVRSFGRNEACYDWQHYIPLIARKPGALRNGAPFADMPEPLLRLRGALLKREGGDRLMAKILAAVPRHGLEAILVAVELVLESGNVSVEHIENVLHRLKSTPPPEQIATTLMIEDAPVADAGRYDRLRTEASHA